MTTSFNPLNHPAIFYSPARRADIGMRAAHLPFLFFLVSVLRPRVLVEAGTADGYVYCGFCQVVAAEGLPTCCYAFPAQPQPQTELRAYHDPLYGSFSTLMTHEPAAGLSQLADGTVDLLHLTGGAHDLAVWLPKLSPRGIVIISPLNSLRGVAAQAWTQAKEQYPHFDFTHDGGLGLLAVGATIVPELAAICGLSAEEGEKVRAFFLQHSRLNQARNLVPPAAVEQKQLELANELTRLRATLAGKEKQLERLQTQLTQRKRQLQTLTEKYTEVVNSDAWWILSQYWILRCKLIPVGSHRERGLKGIARVLRILRQFGVSGILKKLSGRLQRRIRMELIFRTGLFKSVRLPASWQQRLQEQLAGTQQAQAVDEHTLKLIHARAPLTSPALVIPQIETAAERVARLPLASVSVIIPTWNAGDEFAVLLAALVAQQGCDRVEVLVVDSGSTDETVKLAREYGARVIEISQAEFSHAHARNLGAAAATGDYLLFMVQDALPASDLWLYELLSKAQQLQVVAVSCIEAPREDADLLALFQGKSHAEFMGAHLTDRVFEKPASDNYQELRRNCQLNNVACLIERAVFERYSFQGAYAEDLDLGMRLAQDGQRMALLNSVKVVHSHNRPAYYHLKRGYVDCTVMAELFADYPEPLPVEIDKLGREALASFQLLEAVVNQLAESTEFPLPLGVLAALLMKSIEQAYKNPAIVITPPFNSLRDPYTQFLAKLAELAPAPANGKLNGSAFARSVSGVLGYLFDYLASIHQVADAELLARIGEFLQKMHALQLGAYLASSAGAGRARAPVLEWIETELRKGV